MASSTFVITDPFANPGAVVAAPNPRTFEVRGSYRLVSGITGTLIRIDGFPVQPSGPTVLSQPTSVGGGIFAIPFSAPSGSFYLASVSGTPVVPPTVPPTGAMLSDSVGPFLVRDTP